MAHNENLRKSKKGRPILLTLLTLYFEITSEYVLNV